MEKELKNVENITNLKLENMTTHFSEKIANSDATTATGFETINGRLDVLVELFERAENNIDKRFDKFEKENNKKYDILEKRIALVEENQIKSNTKINGIIAVFIVLNAVLMMISKFLV